MRNKNRPQGKRTRAFVCVRGASARQVTAGVVFNSLSPKSDQHQISLCNINAS